jgi:hypothetical protein
VTILQKLAVQSEFTGERIDQSEQLQRDRVVQQANSMLPPGRRIIGVLLTSGTNNYIWHGLGRAYLGYIVTRCYGTAAGTNNVCRLIEISSTVSANQAQTLVLAVVDTCLVDIYIF